MMARLLGGFLLISFFGLFNGYMFDSQAAQHVRARLISEVESVQPGGPFVVGLLLEVEKGWHTYWKNPGDSGMPARIEWDLPDCFLVSETQWPYPERFEMADLVSYGYEGEVVLLTKFEAPPTLIPGSKIEISAHLEYLVCKDECVSGQEDLSLVLPVKDQNPKKEIRWASLFDRTRKNLPQFFEEWKINASLDNKVIFIHILPPVSFIRQIRDILFFPEQEGIIQYAEPQLIKKVRQGYMIEIKRSKISAAVPSRLQGVLYSPSGWDEAGQIKALRVDVPWIALEKSL